MNKKNAGSVMLLLGLLLTLGACQSPPTQIPRPMQDNVTSLLNHPQFRAAAQAAPEFTSTALETVIRLSKDAANHE